MVRWTLRHSRNKESRLEADMQKKESHLQAAAKKAEAAAASSSVMKKLASIDTASVVQYKKMCGCQHAVWPAQISPRCLPDVCQSGDFKSIAAYHHFIGNRDALKSSITKGVLAQKWVTCKKFAPVGSSHGWWPGKQGGHPVVGIVGLSCEQAPSMV
ncbi:unnamed protein product [Symbiodinium microadriaticum]|nr:unnamed protein product [Symbiodinium microadriaticum]